ncbi:MAG: hypothetical protein M1829_001429 [Trizodia sp. TS-e1964]|nr:MAG: hypothetical protein M1829_001429 [Trizodia sp. TS-e1964]
MKAAHAPSPPPSSAQSQAQLRKERRESKIRAGGKDRLNSITSLAGGRPNESLSPGKSPLSSLPRAPGPSNTNAQADPEEVDISQQLYITDVPPVVMSKSSSSPANVQQQLRDQTDAASRRRRHEASPHDYKMGPESIESITMDYGADSSMQDEDPYAKLLQMLVGNAASGQANAASAGLPPDLAAFLGQQQQQQQQQAAEPASTGPDVWRVVHALFALVFGLSLAYTLPASMLPRSGSDSILPIESPPLSIFWIFATVELVLQSTRFFLERGRVGGGGVLVAVAGFLPQPYRGWVELVGRYAVIYTTLMADVMLVVFVLGIGAWWKGK